MSEALSRVVKKMVLWLVFTAGAYYLTTMVSLFGSIAFDTSWVIILSGIVLTFFILLSVSFIVIFTVYLATLAFQRRY